MRLKLIPAKTAQELSRVNHKNRVEKEKQIELKKIMEWIHDGIEVGDDHLFIDNDALKYEENRKVIEELGYKIENVFDYGKRIIWDERKNN